MGRRKLIGFILAGLLLGSLAAQAQESSGEAVAREYMRNGQWDFASHQWRRLIEENPRNLRAQIGLARSLTEGGYVQEAVWQLETLRPELSPSERPDLDVELARAWLAMDNPGKALHCLLEAIRQQPYHLGAYRALMALRDRLPASQRAALETSLEQRAHQAGRRARRLMAAGQYRQSLSYFEVAMAWAQPDGLRNDFGLALLLSGETRLAMAQFQRLREDGKPWGAHANAALAYLGASQTVAARREIEKALALASDNRVKARLYNILGYIYENARKTSEARFAYERAVDLDPALDKARLNLAYIFQQTYQFAPAARVYEGMLAKNPTDAVLWNRLGFVYELMHESRKARAAYEKAIASNPDLQEAYTNLVLLYKKMDEPEKADAVLKQAMVRQFSGIESRGGRPGSVAGKVIHPLLRYVDVFMAEEEKG